MADTIREKIIAAFTTRAQALSNLPIERAQRSIGESDERFCSIWDGEDQLLGADYTQERRQFPIALECIWKHGEDSPSIAANALMGEVMTSMLGAGTDRTFGGLADAVSVPAQSPQYPQDGSDYTTLTVIFSISYTVAAGDPYTVPA